MNRSATSPLSHLSLAAKRMQTALELHAAGVDMYRQTLRRKYPHLSEADIRGKLAAWLAQRPGAEHGDAQGRILPLDRLQV